MSEDKHNKQIDLAATRNESGNDKSTRICSSLYREADEKDGMPHHSFPF